MHKPISLSPRRRWLLSVGLLSVGPLLLACHGLRAQVTAVATDNSTIKPAGPRTGTGNQNFFNVEGNGNGVNADFGVLDFAASAFNLGGQQISGAQNSTLTLSLFESNAAFTVAGSLAFYLTTNTTVGLNDATATGLKYNAGTTTNAFDPPYGVDSKLGAISGGGLFFLGTGSFTTTGNVNNGQQDNYVLTLSAAASQFFASALNATGGDIRLVAAATTDTTAATFAGYTNMNAALRPQLSFTPVFSTANNLYWEGSSSTWAATGGTQWNPTNAAPGSASWNNGGSSVAAFSTTPNSTVTVSGAINAAGLQFDVNGYTIGAAANSNITLGGGAFVQVTNAADTATISAPLAGTVGLNKTGAGTLVLSGTNTYSGGTTLTGGTLSVATAANLGAEGSGLVFNSGTLAVGSGFGQFGSQRAITGSGGSLVYSGSTPLVLNGDVTLTGTLNLPGTGGITLGDKSGRGYDTIGNVGFANAVTLTSTGVLNTSGITATQASGTSVVNGNVLLNATGTAVNTINVANVGATLQITGAIGSGSVGTNGFTSTTGVLVKAGAGTLDLLGDGSALTGATATSGTVRQGVAGTTPATGGTLMVHQATGLGTGVYQFNSGTFVNASGGMLTFTNGLSLGGGQLTGGSTFTGTAGSTSTFTGNASLFNPAGAAYQHVITVNTPTTFAGIFSTGTGTNGGLLVAGTSRLTLAPAAGPNTFTEDIAVSGGTTLTLATTGALGANRSVSLLSNAALTFTLGTGAQDAVNDAAFVNLAANSLVTLNGDNETVGGLALDGATQLAGTYGSLTSTATNKSAYFTGDGILINLGTTAAIPEPSTWIILVAGVGGLGCARHLRSKHSGQAA